MKSPSQFSTLLLSGTFLVTQFLLSGCSNHLIFSERTSFNLAIDVNTDPAVPLKVNIGFDRTIVAMVPPRHETTTELGVGTVADDEAVSLISTFDLHYEDALPIRIFGDLSIKTGFASGQAAINLVPPAKTVATPRTHPGSRLTPSLGAAGTGSSDTLSSHPQGGASNLRVVVPVKPDAASNALDELLRVDGKQFDLTKIKIMRENCWPGAGVPPDTLFTDFMQQSQFADARKKIVACMQSNPSLG